MFWRNTSHLWFDWPGSSDHCASERTRRVSPRISFCSLPLAFPVLSLGVRTDEIRPVLSNDRFASRRKHLCIAFVMPGLEILALLFKRFPLFLVACASMRRSITYTIVHHRRTICPFSVLYRFPALLSGLPQGVISSFPPPLFPFCLLTINYNSILLFSILRRLNNLTAHCWEVHN